MDHCSEPTFIGRILAACLTLILSACSGGVTATITTTGMTSTSTAPGITTNPSQEATTTTFAGTGSGQTATVVSVTDGDTIRVDYEDGNAVAVRLIGINSPEKGECFADKSTRALASMVDGQAILMVSDVSDHDQYGRLLRYLYLPDGTLVNELLVRQGYALTRDYPPDTAQSDALTLAQSRAESEGLGMWAADACGSAETTSGLTVTDVVYDPPGDDNADLNGEWVEIGNQGASTATLTGWVLKDESASHRYTFPDGLTLPPGATLRVHTGCGSDTATDLYWCNIESAVWNNSGDTAFLLDPAGNIHDQFSY